MTSPPRPAPGPLLFGIGLVGASTLLFEVVLTRIFSVTMWYHFAFVAISLALFGLGASGVAVELGAHRFPRRRAVADMGVAALLMGVAIVVGFLADLQIPFMIFDVDPEGGTRLLPYVAFAGKFLVLSLPFFFSGLAIALAFTHRPAPTHHVYFADLVGGGIGCALVVPVLRAYSGPSAIFLAAALAVLAATILLHAAARNRAAAASLLLSVALVAVAGANDRLMLVAISRVKTYDTSQTQEMERPKLYERWHPTSRIAVHPSHVSMTPWAWFQTPRSPRFRFPVLEVTNDAGARTFLYPKMSDKALRETFVWDVTDLVYHILRNPKVLVIGVGGGKDILSAKAFGCARVTGVELNPLMIDIVQREFAEFTGAPYDDPRVEIVLAEGRNFIASRGASYDLIKISCTDTWAASAVGAYALTENYLYTTEAVQEYLSHLERGGFLSFTRVYPREAPRTVALIAEGLRARGADPSERLLMARSDGMFTLVAKASPLTDAERRTFAAAATSAGFVEVPMTAAAPAAPATDLDALVQRIATSPRLADVQREVPTLITPPTDDCPFFFNDVSFHDAAEGDYFTPGNFHFQHGRALYLLVGLLKITTLLTAVFVLGPVLVARSGTGASRRLMLHSNGYFLMLGLGFLLVEIPLLQQFILYLGHPVYATTVVLFALLVSSGIGSLLLARHAQRWGTLFFGLLLGALALAMTSLSPVLRSTIGLPGAARLALSLALLFPLGLLLGIPFPSGLERVRGLNEKLVGWGWAVNGAASVTAPVLAMILAIGWGFRVTFGVGLLVYAVAGVLFALLGIAKADTTGDLA